MTAPPQRSPQAPYPKNKKFFFMFLPKKSKIWFAPVLICLIAALTPVCDASPAKKPDIVFIIVDDLNDWINPLSPPCTMLSTTSLKKQIPSSSSSSL
jgi:hypothetical protein